MTGPTLAEAVARLRHAFPRGEPQLPLRLLGDGEVFLADLRIVLNALADREAPPPAVTLYVSDPSISLDAGHDCYRPATPDEIRGALVHRQDAAPATDAPPCHACGETMRPAHWLCECGATSGKLPLGSGICPHCGAASGAVFDGVLVPGGVDTAGPAASTDEPLDAMPDDATPEPASEDALGRLVRDTWIAWAREQPAPKPSWLVGWDDLDEGQREVDRRIGHAVQASLRSAAPASEIEVRAILEAVELAGRGGEPDDLMLSFPIVRHVYDLVNSPHGVPVGTVIRPVSAQSPSDAEPIDEEALVAIAQAVMDEHPSSFCDDRHTTAVRAIVRAILASVQASAAPALKKEKPHE